MSQIFKSKQSFRWQPIIQEFADKIYFDTVAHDAATLAPIPFEVCDVDHYDQHSLVGKSTWQMSTSEENRFRGSSFIQGGDGTRVKAFWVDKDNSNIGYIMTQNDDSTVMRASKIDLETSTVLATGSYSMRNSSSNDQNGRYYYHGSAYIVDEDDDYLYYIVKTRAQRRTGYSQTYTNTANNMFGYISKATMAFGGNETNDTNFGNSIIVDTNANDVIWITTEPYYSYSYFNSGGSSRIEVNFYNKSAKTLTQALAYNTGLGTNQAYPIASGPVEFVAGTYGCYVAYPSTDPADGYEIDVLTINELGRTAAKQTCTQNWGASSRATIFKQHTWNSREVAIKCFLTKEGATRYLNVMVTETPAQATNGLDTFAIHTFLINSGDITQLTYKSSYVPNARIRDIIRLDDNHTKILVIYDTLCEVVSFNGTTEEYEYTSSINVPAYGIMVDHQNRLWISDTGAGLHLFSTFSPNRISVVSENTSYNYNGSVINTFFNVSAYDIDNNRMATNVKLVLEGASYFTDDTQVKTITTSAAAETQVNFKITGSTFSRVLASIVV